MAMRCNILILAAMAAVSATAAWAQDETVVASSHKAPLPQASDAAAPAATAVTPARPAGDKDQTIAWLNTASQGSLDSRAAAAADPAPAKNGALGLVHGSAGVSVGTGGYRSAYASAVMPVGENGLLGIAVSHTDCGKSGFGCGYNGYGYGGYGYGHHLRGRGGSSDSVALSYMSGGGNDTTTPDGCAPGFRDASGRYIEPMWVTHMRGANDACDAGQQP